MIDEIYISYILNFSFYLSPKQVYDAETDSQGELLVCVNIESDDELRGVCVAREIVSGVQELRKSSGLKIEDVVDIFVSLTGKKIDSENESFVRNAMQQKNRQMVVSRLKCVPTFSSNPSGVVFASNKVTVLKHDKKRSFQVLISFTKPSPCLDRSKILKQVNKDENAVDLLEKMVGMMSVLPKNGETVKLGVFKKDADVKLENRVVVTLTRGENLFASATERSSHMSQ